jgi:hypothetical protein
MSSRIGRLLVVCAVVMTAALPVGAQVAPNEQKDKKVSFQATEMPIGELMGKLAKDSGATILVESTLSNKITLTLTEVSLQEALDTVSRAYGVGLWRIGLSAEEIAKQKIKADDLAKAVRALSLVESKIKGLVVADAKEASVVQLKQTAKRDVAEWQPEKLFPSLSNTYLVCAKEKGASAEANLPANFDVTAFLNLPADQRGPALAPYSPEQRQAIIGTAIKQAIMGFGQLPAEARGEAIRSGFRGMMTSVPPEDRAGLLQITFGVMSQLEPDVFSDVLRNIMPFGMGPGGPPPPP